MFVFKNLFSLALGLIPDRFSKTVWGKKPQTPASTGSAQILTVMEEEMTVMEKNLA